MLATGAQNSMATFFDHKPPVLLQPANEGDDHGVRVPELARPAPTLFAPLAFGLALVLSLLWIGMWIAYLWGYLGQRGIAALDLQQGALFSAAILLPPL